jgi:cytosine/uracil/thiamine/allantoin permease
MLLAGLLVPIGGILLAHFFVLRLPVRVEDLYDASGPYARRHGWAVAGLIAWAGGALVYHLASAVGGTLPSLAATIALYAVFTSLPGRRSVVP